LNHQYHLVLYRERPDVVLVVVVVVVVVVVKQEGAGGC